MCSADAAASRTGKSDSRVRSLTSPLGDSSRLALSSRAHRLMPAPIRRTLAYEDHRQEWRIIGENEIAAFPEPIVILGDPGLGKSLLTKTLGAPPRMRRFPSGTFMRAARREASDQGDRIIVARPEPIPEFERRGAWVSPVPSVRPSTHTRRLPDPNDGTPVQPAAGRPSAVTLLACQRRQRGKRQSRATNCRRQGIVGDPRPSS